MPRGEQRRIHRSHRARGGMTSDGPLRDEQPAASVLTLGVSPWMRHADAPAASPTGAPLPVVQAAPAVQTLPDPAAGATVAPTEPVSLAAAVASGVVLPTPVTIAAGPAAPVAVVVPTKEAKVRAATAREETRQRINIAEERLHVEDEKYIRLSRFLLVVGLFGLPAVHFMQVWYFAREMLDKNSNWFVRRNAFLALLVGSVELVVFVAWIVLYQTRSANFDALNILTSNISLANLT